MLDKIINKVVYRRILLKTVELYIAVLACSFLPRKCCCFKAGGLYNIVNKEVSDININIVRSTIILVKKLIVEFTLILWHLSSCADFTVDSWVIIYFCLTFWGYLCQFWGGIYVIVCFFLFWRYLCTFFCFPFFGEFMYR